MHLKMGVDRPETATVQKAEERVFFFLVFGRSSFLCKRAGGGERVG